MRVDWKLATVYDWLVNQTRRSVKLPSAESAYQPLLIALPIMV